MYMVIHERDDGKIETDLFHDEDKAEKFFIWARDMYGGYPLIMDIEDFLKSEPSDDILDDMKF